MYGFCQVTMLDACCCGHSLSILNKLDWLTGSKNLDVIVGVLRAFSLLVNDANFHLFFLEQYS